MHNVSPNHFTLPHEEILKRAYEFQNDDTIYHELTEARQQSRDVIENQTTENRNQFDVNFQTNLSESSNNVARDLNSYFQDTKEYISKSLNSAVENLTPRSLHRSYSRTFSSWKKTMRFTRQLLLLCCLILVFCGGVMLIKTKQENAAYALKLDYLNKTSRFLRWKLNTQRITRRSPTQKVSPKKRKSLGNPFNSETWDNRTANLRKHYVILYWSKIRGHIARLQNKKEYEKDQHVWPYTYVGEKCPVSCELTNNRSRAKEADAFVVHSRLTDVWDFPPFKYLAPWILQNNENPVYTPALSDPRIMNKFNLLISYRLDSDFPSPIYPMPSQSKPIPFKDRLGDVLAVFSKCEVVRTEYMRQLMNFIDVHSYGACLKNKDGLIGLYGQVNGKYVFKDYKLVLTRFYKFSLVFMNQDCDYFVDDRLYHALETGSVPVYMGTDKIDEFLPGNLRNAIIKVSDFSSPKELADHLKYLSNNETAYNKYLDWKKDGVGDMNGTTIGRWWKPQYPLFCQVCMRLSQGNLHPGLNVDTCRPRQYLDWNLYPPYGSQTANLKLSETVQINHTKSTLFLYSIFFLFVIGCTFLMYLIVRSVVRTLYFKL